MAGKRRWRSWYKRFTQELNGTSGLASLGGALLAVISFMGLNAFSGTIAAFTGGIGIFITTVAVGMAVYKAIPPILRNPSDHVGQRLSLDKLADLDPPPLKLSVVGPPMAGKSTLVSRILQQIPPNQRTQSVHAYIAALQISPPHYLAMLDGSGQMYADQFEIGASADILCIILDHNRSDTEKNVDNSRISEHLEFNAQLRGYLGKQNRKLTWVHLLLNKRDLWKNTLIQERQTLTKFLQGEEKEWRQSNLAKNVTSEEYSNRYPDDGGILLQKIYEFLKEQNEHR
jgi:hypothetical protein